MKILVFVMFFGILQLTAWGQEEPEPSNPNVDRYNYYLDSAYVEFANGWKRYGKFEYDSRFHCTLQYWDLNMDGNIFPMERYILTPNISGRVERQQLESYFDKKWRISMLRSFQYHKSGKIEIEEWSLYNSSGQPNGYPNRYQFEYDDLGNILNYFRRHYNKTEKQWWTSLHQEYVFVDGIPIKKIETTEQLGKLVPSRNYYLEYDDNDLLSSNLCESYMENTYWKNSFKETFQYDEKRRLTKMNYYLWSQEQWLPTHAIHYEYNNSNSLIGESYIRLTSSEGNAVKDSVFLYKTIYDSLSNITLWQGYNWDEGVKEKGGKDSIILHDHHGNRFMIRGVRDNHLITEAQFFWKIPKPEKLYLKTPVNREKNVNVDAEFIWYHPKYGEEYDIQISRFENFDVILEEKLGLWDTVFVFKDLDYKTNYYWRVRPRNTSHVGEWSSTRTFTTSIAPPPATILTLPDDGTKDIPTKNALLNWETIEAADEYVLQLSRDDEFIKIVYSNDSLNTNIVEIAMLDQRTNYYWRVRAENSGGYGEWSDTWSFTTEILPPIDELLLVSPIDKSSNLNAKELALSWEEDNFAISYKLELSENDDFSIVDYTFNDLPETNWTIDSVKWETKYFWRVRAENEAGSGPWSEVWSFSTMKFVSVGEDDDFGITVYPNPASDRVTFSFNTKTMTDINLEIFDALGIMVAGIKETGKNEISLETNEFNSGVYFYRVSVSGKLLFGKLIISH